MSSIKQRAKSISPLLLAFLASCTAQRVDMSGLTRPARAPELDAYETFVGSWTWEAVMMNAADANRNWTGTAEWRWTLDNRCLEGKLSAKSASANFDAQGIWSWHPRSRKYIWWMFNNWGYPQEGKASYNEATKTWTMNYTSVGLDGSTSFGRYTMSVVDQDTLDWTVSEWVDPAHLITKMEMRGTYKRQR